MILVLGAFFGSLCNSVMWTYKITVNDKKINML